MAQSGRQDERQAITLKIRFKTATLTAFIEQYSNDISRGGIFIKMKSPMPVGTLIKFDFRLQDEKALIQGVGRVVWRREEEGALDSPPGMGIKFIKLDPASLANLETILQAKKQEKSDRGGAANLELKPMGAEPSKSDTPLREKAPAFSAGSSPQAGVAPKPVLEPSVRMTVETIAALDKKEETDSSRIADVQPTLADAGNAQGAAAQGKPSFMDDSVIDDKFLDDISQAIDTVLGQGELKSKIPKPAGSPENQAPAGSAEAQPAAVSPKATVDSLRSNGLAEPGAAKSRGGLIAVLILLIAAAAGAAVWYFKFRVEPADVEVKARPAARPLPRKAQPATQNPVQPISTDQARQPEGVKPQAPEPPPAVKVALEIKSNPAGARLLVKGRPHSAVTPTRVEDLTSGEEVEVEARLFGYISNSKKIVLGNQPAEMVFALQPARLELEVKSDPVGASVSIAGKSWGKTPNKSTLPHQANPEIPYSLTKLGYDDFTGKIAQADWTEKDGVFSASVNVMLNKKEKTKQPSVKPPPLKPQPKPTDTAESAGKPVGMPKEQVAPKEEKTEQVKPKEEKTEQVKPKEEKTEQDKSNIEENPF